MIEMTTRHVRITGLAAFTGGDTNSDIHAVLLVVSNPQRPAARLFRLLGLHAGPEISTAATGGDRSLRGRPGGVSRLGLPVP
jgi:hypothetical protein